MIFLNLVLFPDEIVLEIDLDLFTLLTMSSVSVFWVDIDLSNYSHFSDLLMLDVSNFLSDACDLSVLLNVSIFFFCNERSDGFLHHIRFCSHVSIPFFDNRVSSSDQWLLGFIQTPNWFSLHFTWINRFLLQRVTYIWRQDFSARFSLPGYLQNQSHLWIVINLVQSVLAI